MHKSVRLALVNDIGFLEEIVFMDFGRLRERIPQNDVKNPGI